MKMQSELTVRFLGMCLLAALAKAHMELVDPAPFRSKNNPDANGDDDVGLVAPISGDTSSCKRYQSFLGSPAGGPVAAWEAWSEQSITIGGGAPHESGSCQVSPSLNKGGSFTVIRSYVGGCPTVAPESTFSFRIPADSPASNEASPSWSWSNKFGNREFYQNCAPTMAKRGKAGSEDVPFGQRPAMFTAHLENGCETVASKDVMFPDPGLYVDVNNPGASASVGNCGSASPSPGAGSGKVAGVGQKAVVQGSSDGSAATTLLICTCESGESHGSEGQLYMSQSDAESGKEAMTSYIVVLTALVLAVGVSLA